MYRTQENLLVADWGAVKVADFGLAMQLGATAPGQPAGTPPTWRGGPRFPALWLWMRWPMWEAATSQHPFTPPHSNAMLVLHAMQAPRFLHLPCKLGSFLYCFQPQPTRPSATEALDFLHRLPYPPSTASRRGRRARRVLAFLGLIINNQELCTRRESAVFVLW